VTEEELPRSRIEPTSSDSAVVFVLDAVILMLLAGMFQVLVGLLAIFENEIYVQTRNYLFKFDVTTWGVDPPGGGGCGWPGRIGIAERADLGQGGWHHPGRAQRHRQLPVHSLLPGLVAAHHRG
jgi:hypothetical protein